VFIVNVQLLFAIVYCCTGSGIGCGNGNLLSLVDDHILFTLIFATLFYTYRNLHKNPVQIRVIVCTKYVRDLSSEFYLAYLSIGCN